MLTISQSNKREYIGKDLVFNAKKDKLIIGWKVLGLGSKFEVSCNDVKEFKILDENSKTIRSTSALKKTGGAVVGGILTGGIGAIVGAMVTGNKTKKSLKINLGFKIKNKDWFVATLDVDDKTSLTSGMFKTVVDAIIKRFSVKTKAPF